MNPTAAINQPNNIEKIIEDSKKEINEIENKEIKKSGRGRPKKLESSQTTNQLPVKVNPEQYKNFLKVVLEFSGIYLAKATDFEGFKLSKEESELIASQGSEICVDYLPQIDSKYIKLGAFTVTVASVYGIKVMAYQEAQKSKLASLKVIEETKINEIQAN